MVSISKGHSFTEREQVTNLKLNSLVDDATIGEISNEDIASDAGIDEVKLDLDGSSVVLKTGTQTISGDKTFTGTVVLPTIDAQVLTDVDINSGAVDNTTIGAATPSSIVGTTIKANTTFEGASGTTINEFSIDGTLAGNSDDAVPTEKAVKTYVDGLTSPSSNTIWSSVTDYTFTTGASYASFGDTLAIVKSSDYETVRVYFRLALDNDFSNYDPDIQVTIGSVDGNAIIETASDRTSPQWCSDYVEVDVSTLSDGTLYEVTFEQKYRTGASGASEMYITGILIVAT